VQAAGLPRAAPAKLERVRQKILYAVVLAIVAVFVWQMIGAPRSIEDLRRMGEPPRLSPAEQRHELTKDLPTAEDVEKAKERQRHAGGN
jgi:hypothetical protein